MKRQVVALGALLMLTLPPGYAHATDVAYAGFAYAGDFQSIRSRFPFTTQVVPPHAGRDDSEPSAVEKQLVDGARHVKPAHFNLIVDSLSTLQGRDEAVMVALVATGETVSTERIGDETKLFINLRAQALFFDFKSMMVLRAYPISIVYIGATPSEPTDAQRLTQIRELISGGQQPGLVGHFLQRLENASLPSAATRRVRVTDVVLGPEAAAALPAYLGGAGVAETWLADQFSAAVLEKTGVPILPYSKGYAVGNTMSARVADGTVYTLTIPEADYSVSLELQSLKKVKFAQVPAGTSFIYGGFVHLLVQEQVSQHRYFDTVLKNGETKVVPATQSSVDDWPAFQDSITGLFNKFSATVGGTDDKWIRSSAGAADVMQQVTATRTVLKSCI